MAIGILQLGQAYIQSTRHERLETEKLVQVTVPSKNLVWEEEGRELWVGDRMFDVASFTLNNGNYYLLGVYDDDETEVAGSLLHLMLSNDGKSLLQFLLLLQFFTLVIVIFRMTVRITEIGEWNQFSIQTYLSPLLLVAGPPPKQ